MTEPGTTEADSDASSAASTRPRGRRWGGLLAWMLVLAVAITGWSLYRNLDGNIRTDSDTAHALAPYAKARPIPVRAAGAARNILVLGSDNRGNGNGAYGRDEGSQRSDTAILLHIAADGRSATGMSIPRDLMVHAPDCRRPDGSQSRAQFAQFNWALQTGGAACVIRTVEKMTDIRVDHHLVVDFRGFKKLVAAVGGVEVCLAEPVHDREAKLDLPAGRQTLQGEDALGYVRARHGLGNGSDTQRVDRQQRFMGSLVKKVRSNGVLLNPTRAYPVLDAATSSLTADSGLDSLSELHELVRSVRDIPEDRIRFLTVPRQSYQLGASRDQLVQPDTERLFTKLREDRPVHVKDGDVEKEGGKEKGDGSYRGTTADLDICANE